MKALKCLILTSLLSLNTYALAEDYVDDSYVIEEPVAEAIPESASSSEEEVYIPEESSVNSEEIILDESDSESVSGAEEYNY